MPSDKPLDFALLFAEYQKVRIGDRIDRFLTTLVRSEIGRRRDILRFWQYDPDTVQRLDEDTYEDAVEEIKQAFILECLLAADCKKLDYVFRETIDIRGLTNLTGCIFRHFVDEENRTSGVGNVILRLKKVIREDTYGPFVRVERIGPGINSWRIGPAKAHWEDLFTGDPCSVSQSASSIGYRRILGSDDSTKAPILVRTHTMRIWLSEIVQEVGMPMTFDAIRKAFVHQFQLEQKVVELDADEASSTMGIGATEQGDLDPDARDELDEETHRVWQLLSTPERMALVGWKDPAACAVLLKKGHTSVYEWRNAIAKKIAAHYLRDLGTERKAKFISRLSRMATDQYCDEPGPDEKRSL